MIDKQLEEWYKEKIDQTKSIWILQWFLRRLQKNQNAIVVFTGGTGSGKSLTAIRLAELLDPGFSASRIVFTVKDFVKLVNSNLGSGSVIVFDDAGLGINSREWRAKHAKIFGMLTQGFRYKQIITIITVPFLGFIEKQSRKLVHLVFESTDTQGKPKPKLISENPYDPEHPMKKYPTIERGYDTIKVTGVHFKLPSKTLKDEYEKAKAEYMQATFMGFGEQLSSSEEQNISPKIKEEAIHLICGNCGYGWDYTGRKFSPQCPNCGRRVEAVKNVDKNYGIEVICSNPLCGYKWNYTGKNRDTRCPKCGKHVTVELPDI